MGKISLKTLSVMAVSVVAISAFSGCSQPAKEVKLFKDASIMNNYMDGVSNFDSVEYEQITYTDGTNGLGPSDKRYRGFVCLNEEGSKNLFFEYDWEETTAPEFEFDKLDGRDIGGDHWFVSTQFNAENYGELDVNYAVFNGKYLVFDVQDQ